MILDRRRLRRISRLFSELQAEIAAPPPKVEVSGASGRADRRARRARLAQAGEFGRIRARMERRRDEARS